MQEPFKIPTTEDGKPLILVFDTWTEKSYTTETYPHRHRSSYMYDSASESTRTSPTHYFDGRVKALLDEHANSMGGTSVLVERMYQFGDKHVSILVKIVKNEREETIKNHPFKVVASIARVGYVLFLHSPRILARLTRFVLGLERTQTSRPILTFHDPVLLPVDLRP